MKISAGRIGFVAQFQLQCSALLVPWVEKRNVITCLKKRDYSSKSVPVRYVPKKSSQSEKLENLESETAKKSNWKYFSEFSEPSPQSNNEASYGGKFIRKGFDFDGDDRYRSQMNNSKALFDDQDKSTEDDEEISEDDDITEEPEASSFHRQGKIYSDHREIRPLKDEIKNSDKKFAMRNVASQDRNVAPKSINVKTRLQYQTHMLGHNLVLHNAKQGNHMDEPLDYDNDDSIEDFEDELSEDSDGMKEDIEDVEVMNIHKQNRSDKHNEFQPKTKHDAVKAAGKLLARRTFTTVELKKRLLGKSFPTSVVEEVIRDLQSGGYLNDEWYAESYSQSKWRSSTWGPQRIKHQLRMKGLNKLDSDKAIQIVFKDGGESEGLCHGLSKTAMERLIFQASKQWVGCRDVPAEKRKARVIRWLMYRGFTWNVIGFVVRKLESSYRF